jgi:hypothetical protein
LNIAAENKILKYGVMMIEFFIALATSFIVLYGYRFASMLRPLPDKDTGLRPAPTRMKNALAILNFFAMSIISVLPLFIFDFRANYYAVAFPIILITLARIFRKNVFF